MWFIAEMIMIMVCWRRPIDKNRTCGGAKSSRHSFALAGDVEGMVAARIIFAKAGIAY